MNIIKAITKRGLELRGAIYGDSSNDTVLIMMTGISSNVFQNDLLDATGKLLSQNGITTIIGHASDSFSCFSFTTSYILVYIFLLKKTIFFSYFTKIM